MKKKNQDSPQVDLSRLKKKDLLEIMLKQGEEIDSLRAQIEELQAKLDEKELKISQAGSIAQASLAITNIFEEAQKAADVYLQNVRRITIRPVERKNPDKSPDKRLDKSPDKRPKKLPEKGADADGR